MSKRRFVWVAGVFCMLAVAVVACAHQIMSYCKIVALDVGTVNDFSGNLVGNVGGEAGKSHFLAGSGFYNNAGTLTLLDDATRTPQNVSSIAANGTYLSRLTLANTGDKTNWITASPSDELAVLGYQPSVSAVAASTVDIGGYAPMVCEVDAVSAAITDNSLLGSSVTGSLVSDVLTLTYPAGDSVNPPVITPKYYNIGRLSMMAAAQTSATTTDLFPVSDMAAQLYYNGSTWLFLSGCQDCSWATAAPAAGGTIAVTHTALTSTQTDAALSWATAGTVTYRVAVVASSNTGLEIAFINNAGTVITTPDTDMVVYIRKKILAHHQYLDNNFANQYINYVQQGPVLIPTANLQNVSGGEVFVSESMDY